jgi:hypothetical protein
MPRPSAHRQFPLLANQCYFVVLKICKEVMLFTSAMLSEISRFKFAVSWLCQVKLLITNNAVGLVQRATAQPKQELFVVMV